MVTVFVGRVSELRALYPRYDVEEVDRVPSEESMEVVQLREGANKGFIDLGPFQQYKLVDNVTFQQKIANA